MQGVCSEHLIFYFLRLRSRFSSIQEILYLLKHRLNIPKRPVNASKADISNLIHSLQMFHHQFTNDVTRYLLPAQAIEFLLDLFNRIFNFAYWQWALLASLADTYIKLLPVKIFSPLVAFNHHQVKFFNSLIGTEASLTRFTFAPAMYGITDITRIFHPRLSTAT